MLISILLRWVKEKYLTVNSIHLELLVYAINVEGTIKVGLASTGIDRIISIIDEKKLSEVEMVNVDKQDFADKRSKTEHILEAHKILMTLNDENKKVFKNVVELMEKELEK